MASKPTAHSDMLVVYSLAHMVLPATSEWGLSGTHVEGDCVPVCCTGGSSPARQEIDNGRYIGDFSPTMLPPHRNTLLVIASSLLAV
jgi:hypothetical protein